MEQKQIKGIVIKIQDKYIKFKKNSITFDRDNNLVQGELLNPTRLNTLNGQLLIFKGMVKFSNQKVKKGFLAKPQKAVLAGKKINLSGFVQFTEKEVLNKNKKFSEDLSSRFSESLLELVEDDLCQAETIEYFTLAHHQYITRPQQRLIKIIPRQNLKIQPRKFQNK